MIYVFLIAAFGLIGTAFVIKPYFLTVATCLLLYLMIIRINFPRFKKRVTEWEQQNGSP